MCTQRSRSGSFARYERLSPELLVYSPFTRSCSRFTLLASPATASWEPKVVTVSQRIVPASRPSASCSYLECCATPARVPGCRACISNALMPHTSVPTTLCTIQGASVGRNKPPVSPLAMTSSQGGVPLGSLESSALNLLEYAS